MQYTARLKYLTFTHVTETVKHVTKKIAIIGKAAPCLQFQRELLTGMLSLPLKLICIISYGCITRKLWDRPEILVSIGLTRDVHKTTGQLPMLCLGLDMYCTKH